ncbi:MAG: insulinase family protein [Actinomycetota bacterium]
MAARRSRRSLRAGAFLVLAALIAGCVSEADSDDAGDTSPAESADPSDRSDGDPDADSDAASGTGTASDGDEASGDGSTPGFATEPPDPDGLPSLSTPDPDTRAGTLDNGLRYLVRSNDNPGSKAELRLTIDAGSVLEDDEQIGGAHYLEHMLFNGTERFPENELTQILRSFGAAFGADVNAYTSYDETVYELNVPADGPGGANDTVRLALEVFEQWLTAATLAPDDVEAERGVILDELRVRDETSQGRLGKAVTELFLDGSPYEGRRPIGTEAAIVATTPDPLRRFYDDWYRPELAGVVVVGDIDVDRTVEWIDELFADEAARGSSPERPVPVVDPPTSTEVRIESDPDLVEGYVFVTLPTSIDESLSPEAAFQEAIHRSLAFDVIATRLDDSATRGEAPFDSARVDSSAFARSMVAPEIFVSTDGDQAEASAQAIVDEYERVRRFGISPAELERAVDSRRSRAVQSFESRGSRQDSSYAEEYVRHLLEGEWYVTAEQEFAAVSEILDRATPANVVHVFVDQLDTAGAHVFVAVRDDEADLAPTTDRLVEIVDGVGDRDLDPPAAPVEVGDSLIDPVPDPVDETGVEAMIDDSFTSILEPTVMTFPNGVRFAYNTTTIVESTVFLDGRSPGGLAVLDESDVAAALAVPRVIGESGVGDVDRVALEAFLDDKEVSLGVSVDLFEETLSSSAATSDIETLFQLVHLTMTAPRIDDVAVDRYVDDLLPLARDPSIDTGYAEYVALRDARYDDPRFRAPGADEIEALAPAAVSAVVADRFGDAGDWSFSLSGDVDPEVVRDLARRYLGTLPATGRVDAVDYVEPPPPEGVVVAETTAGEGQTARISLLFSTTASPDRRDDVAARIVDEVVSDRLTTVVRERLGETYSPFAVVTLGIGDDPALDGYITISANPDDVSAVSAATVEELADLGTVGPSPTEFDSAVAVVSEELGFVSDVQINQEVLDVLLDPSGTTDFRDFVFESELVSGFSRTEIQSIIAEWFPTDRYVELRIVPR